MDDDCLPLVSVGVGSWTRIEAAAAEVQRLRFDGLITFERARLLTGHVESLMTPLERDQSIELTI